MDHVEGDITQRPEVPATTVTADEIGQRVAEGVLPRQAQAVANPEPADIDGGTAVGLARERSRGRCHRTFANVGSTRLKNHSDTTRKAIDTPSTLPSASQSGASP